MAQEQKITDIKIEKNKLFIEFGKAFIYVVTVIVSIMLFINSFERRLSVVESDLQRKIEIPMLYDKIDELKKIIENKIEYEMEKVRKELR